MSKFTDFIDHLADDAGKLAKDELKTLVENAQKDSSDFVRMQANNFQRLTEMLADGELTPKGYKILVRQLEVLDDLQGLKLSVAAKASAQRLAQGLQSLVVDALFALI